MFFVESINKFIKRGEPRSIGIKKNIALSFVVKGLSIAINFSVVPLTIDYVNSVQYGIWLTFTSIISWITFFDLGMSNGLRNRLTTAIALKEYDKAKKYISTSYAVFFIIAVSIFVLFYFINPKINWNDFLNIPSTVSDDIHVLILIVLATFCIQFVVQLLNTVLTALQKPANFEFITLLGQIGLLITLIILKNTTKGSLSVLLIALNIVPVLVIVLASLFLFSGRLKFIAPSLKEVDFSYAKSILGVGATFFLIQIGAMILFQTDNIIIAKILGPESVTKFNVTYKLYSILILAFSIVATPYWSAFTDAKAKEDYSWIKRSIKKLREVWLFASFIVVPIFFLLSKFIFKIWLPNSVDINLSLSILMAVYVMCYTCLVLNCYFLNGIGKLKIQMFLYLLVMITNIPVGIAMGKWWGIEGVILANIIAFVLMNVILWIQTNKLLNQKASGIWNA